MPHLHRSSPSRFLGLLALSSVALSASVAAQSVPHRMPQHDWKVSDPHAPQRDVFDFDLSPDGRTVLYRVDQHVDETYGLFAVSIDAYRSAVEISGPLVAGGDVVRQGYAVSPDGQRVAYLADQDQDNDVQLYGAMIDGSGSPILLSTPSTGAVGLPGNSVPDTRVGVAFPRAPGSDRVVYVSNFPFPASGAALYSVPLDGSALPVRLDAPLPEETDSLDFWVAPDGARVVYCAFDFQYFQGDVPLGLFTVPIDGSSAPVRLADDGSLPVFRADGTEFIAVASTPLGNGLHRFATDGNGTPIFLSADALIEYDVDPTWARVVYRALLDDQWQLFSVPTDASAAPVQLNDPLHGDGAVTDFVIAPGGQRVAYVEDDYLYDSVNALFSVSIDGTAAPVPLLDPAVPTFVSGNGQVLHQVQVSPDGASVVFHQMIGGVGGIGGVYSVPIRGTTLPVRLNAELPPGRITNLVTMTPDGGQTLYIADLEVSGKFELFQTATEGGGAVTRVNGPMIPGGDVQGQQVRVAPDGSRALYLADQERDEDRELFASFLRRPPSPSISGTVEVEAP